MKITEKEIEKKLHESSKKHSGHNPEGIANKEDCDYSAHRKEFVAWMQENGINADNYADVIDDRWLKNKVKRMLRREGLI